MPLPVTLDLHDPGRHPSELEAAVYFCCVEALQNAAKHSRAGRVRVSLGADHGSVWFTVQDDGVGFEPGQRRVGRDGQHAGPAGRERRDAPRGVGAGSRHDRARQRPGRPGRGGPEERLLTPR